MHNPSKTLLWTSWDLHIYHTEIIIILSAASRDGVLVVVFKASVSQESASLVSLPPSREYVVSTSKPTADFVVGSDDDF